MDNIWRLMVLYGSKEVGPALTTPPSLPEIIVLPNPSSETRVTHDDGVEDIRKIHLQ